MDSITFILNDVTSKEAKANVLCMLYKNSSNKTEFIKTIQKHQQVDKSLSEYVLNVLKRDFGAEIEKISVDVDEQTKRLKVDMIDSEMRKHEKQENMEHKRQDREYRGMADYSLQKPEMFISKPDTYFPKKENVMQKSEIEPKRCRFENINKLTVPIELLFYKKPASFVNANVNYMEEDANKRKKENLKNKQEFNKQENIKLPLKIEEPEIKQSTVKENLVQPRISSPKPSTFQSDISILQMPNQCITCTLRFLTYNDLLAHLSTHSRHENKDSGLKTRSFFVPFDIFTSKNINLVLDPVQKQEHEFVYEGEVLCQVCGLEIGKNWSDEKEEWVLEDALRVDEEEEKFYHRRCVA